MRKETLEKNYPCSTKEIRDEAYEQGRADGAREFAEWLEDNDLEFRCSGCKFKKECESESADNTNITCVEFILAEWQKGE